jgi:hypothetical protein
MKQQTEALKSQEDNNKQLKAEVRKAKAAKEKKEAAANNTGSTATATVTNGVTTEDTPTP